MARGWESKSVESQMETAQERRARKQTETDLSAEQAQLRQDRDSLLLSMTRVRQELEAATHPRRREQLEAALRHLEEKLAQVGEA